MAPPRPPPRLPASVLLSGGQAPFTSPRDFQTSLAADVRKAGDLGLTCRGMVCVLKGFSGGGGVRGTCSLALPPWLHRGHPTGPGAPPVAVWRKGSLSWPQVNEHLNGAAVGHGEGRGSKFLVPLQNVTRVIFELKVFLVLNKGAWLLAWAWVPALPVSDEVKQGEGVHARLTSGLQMGQNCHGPSPSCVKRRFPVELNMDKWGTAPVCPRLRPLQDSLCLQGDGEPGSRTRSHLWIRLLQVPGSGG